MISPVRRRYRLQHLIDHNQIGNISTASQSPAFAISLGLTDMTSLDWSGSEVSNASVDHNIIRGVASTNGLGLSAGGIIVASAATGTTTIDDNFVMGVTSPAIEPDMSVGILLGGGNATTRVVFNTVSMVSENLLVILQQFGHPGNGGDSFLEAA